MKLKLLILALCMGILVSLVSASPQQIYPNQNPLDAYAVYLMNGSSGDLTNYNGSSNGATITAINTPTYGVTGPNASITAWDGIALQKEDPDSFQNTSYTDLGSNWTVAVWHNSNASIEQHFVGLDQASVGVNWLRDTGTIGSFSSKVNDQLGSVNTNCDSSTQWCLIVWQCDGANAYLYTNDNSTEFTWNVVTCDVVGDSLYLGYDTRSLGTSHLNGTLGGVYVWNRSLVQSERTQLYQSNWTAESALPSGSTINFTAPTLSNGTYRNVSSIPINITFTNTSVIKNSSMFLWNTSFSVINSSNSTTSPFYTLFSNVPDGTWHYNASVNGTSPEVNSTETRTILIDTVLPIVNFSSFTEDNGSTLTIPGIRVNGTCSDINFANCTFYLFNESFVVLNKTNVTAVTSQTNFSNNIIDGLYYFDIVGEDLAGNVRRSRRQVIVSLPAVPTTANNLVSVFPGLNGSISQNFKPNFTVVDTQLNWSDNVTQKGNFSWNFTQFNVTTLTGWTINITNDAVVNKTITAKINGTFDSNMINVWVSNSTGRVNLTNSSYLTIVNLPASSVAFINITIDLFNMSQTYTNWALVADNTNYTFNISYQKT